MRILENIISDRGSRYAVSGGPCTGPDDARAFIATLRRNRKFARATHHSWAALCESGVIRNDDGEAGAAQIIQQMLERAELRDHIIVVTRWYGGKHLGGDRFRHIRDAVRAYLAEVGRG